MPKQNKLKYRNQTTQKQNQKSYTALRRDIRLRTQAALADYNPHALGKETDTCKSTSDIMNRNHVNQKFSILRHQLKNIDQFTVLSASDKPL